MIRSPLSASRDLQLKYSEISINHKENQQLKRQREHGRSKTDRIQRNRATTCGLGDKT